MKLLFRIIILLSVNIFITAFLAFGQSGSFTFSGTVSTKENPEGVQGVKILIEELKINTITDVNGFFYFSIPYGTYTVLFKTYGFETVKKTISIIENKQIEINLKPIVKDLEEVRILAKTGSKDPSHLGQIELKMKDIKNLPAFMGEIDILKTIQLLPGVSSVNEGGQGFYVRGGSPDQNLVLVDDVPIYNASHLFGFFSVFNSDAVQSANLIKGTMPAHFGGRMSSVLEITTNEGNKDHLKINGGIGLIASRLEIESPFANKKGTIMVAGRRTYLDLITKPFISNSSPFFGSSYFFYDLNIKINYQLGKKDKIQFTSYYGIDEFKYVNKTDEFNVKIPWGNSLYSIKWNHIFNSKLFLQTTSYSTKYNFSFGSEQTEFAIKLSSGISDLGQKIDFTYNINEKHKVKYGIDYTFHKFTPSSLSASQGSTPLNPGASQNLYSHETGIYITDDYKITNNFNLSSGIRYSMFHFVGPFTRYVHDNLDNVNEIIQYNKNQLVKWYGGFEPRITLKYQLKNIGTFKAGYSYNYQYIHLTSLSALSLPTDIWFPTTDLAKPQKGYQISLGYFKNYLDDIIETSIEIYYKGLKNLVEYKPGALPSDNLTDNVDNLLVFGTGKSYGIEFFVRKNVGKFTGWIGYTLAKTERYFPDIQAIPFPAKYDRRHDLSITSTYKLNERWTFGAAYVYATGNTMTLPSNWYLHEQNLLLNYYSRNSTRMPSYHRLDISITFYDKATKKKYDTEINDYQDVKKRFRSNWNFSIYNLYNQANPFFLYLQGSGYILKGNFKMSVKQVTLFPIIPSITWNFSF